LVQHAEEGFKRTKLFTIVEGVFNFSRKNPRYGINTLVNAEMGTAIAAELILES
jgi:hypothetical protein